jgi:hypothetical protein
MPSVTVPRHPQPTRRANAARARIDRHDQAVYRGVRRRDPRGRGARVVTTERDAVDDSEIRAAMLAAL